MPKAQYLATSCVHMKPLYLTLAVLMAGTATSSALDIVFNTAAGMDQRAIDGFEAAAAYWESTLTDNVTININIDFRTLDPGVLGQAGSTSQVVSIANYFAALNADASSANDLLAVANLPGLTGGGISFLTQTNTESPSSVSRETVSLDNNNSSNNRFLSINTANAKAVGLFTGSAAASDASITFSDAFSWDFDQSDGVGAGLQDFVGVAIHEIGHSLGFNSGVDTVDYFISNQNGGQWLDLDPYAIYTGMDMFRYSAEDVLNLAAGAASYFSIDGGATNEGLFSTGVENGDGRQASHWKDNLGLGIMDPTANPPGNENHVSALDLLAFDVIGWDLAQVPEPSSMTLLMLLGGAMVMRRKRA